MIRIACLLAIAAFMPGSVLAQPATCGPHDDVVARLASGYGESRQSIALGANNTVVETFASIQTRSWTITVTNPGGLTCIVAAGHEYQYLAESVPNTDPAL